MHRGGSFKRGAAANSLLKAFSLQQVRLLISEVIVDVAEDCFFIFLLQVAAEFPGGTHPEGIRFDNRLLGDEGTSGDDGARSDDSAVEDDRAHPDETPGIDFAAVEDGVVAHGNIVANVDAVLFFHAVEDAVVLNVGIVAHADLVYVAAEDGVHPDTGVLADDDVTDELGGVVDVAGFGELGSDAFVGADHGYLMLEALRRTIVSQDAMVRGERPSYSHLANSICDATESA